MATAPVTDPPVAETADYSDLVEFFDRFAANEPKWRRRNRTYHRLLEQLHRFQIPEGARVLEIGSGSGDLLAALRPSYGVGVDVSPGMVALARERHPELRFEVSAGEELARRVPWLARPVLGRARAVVAASTELAGAAERLGAPDVHVIPNGVDVPAEVGEPEEPPHVLFAGRLSSEKGVLDLVEAARGLPLVVAGDGPLRPQVPGALGFVPHDELLRLYGRAAVVACPSRREGYGVVCAEAMAHGRAVVVTPVGGMRDLVEDGVNGLVVPVGDVPALRAALERLLGDADLRARLGAAGREAARKRLSWETWTSVMLRVYTDARHL
jgi:glycosyltransferase involved in cell wall biosynthesis